MRKIPTISYQTTCSLKFNRLMNHTESTNRMISTNLNANLLHSMYSTDAYPGFLRKGFH